MFSLGFPFLLLLGTSFGAEFYDRSPPKFSNTYTTKGTLYIPYVDLKEPFYAWYDGPRESSRIDYYGGMVKTFQLSQKGDFGMSLKIAPVTMDMKENTEMCFQVNGTQSYKIQPQSIVPDTDGMKFKGTDMLNGIECEKWMMIDEIGEKRNIYTLWIRYKASKKTAKTAIPVKYEMRGFNSLLGSHYDHYYLVYSSFSSDPPGEDVFKITDNKTCISFPGPGDKHIYTFNPMKEYIHNYDNHVESEFDDFKHRFNRNFTDNDEHYQRKNIFRQNMRFIHSINRANLGYQLKQNHLTDRSELEMKALRGKLYTPGYNGGKAFPHDIEKEIKDVPESMDWRLEGAVTPVKDQSVCGSCWSFGTTGTVEGAYFLKTGNLVRLSEQALVDCSWGFGNNGCDGGEDFRSYEWMMKFGGLPSDEDYGDYLGQDGYCHAKDMKKTAKITGFVNVTSNSIDALKIAIFKHGPISISIDASHRTFSFFSHGVYYDPECANTIDKMDHAVLAVGYGTLNGQDYWLVKNSWSNYWGNDGYILISQKQDDCGVLLTPTYVTMD